MTVDVTTGDVITPGEIRYSFSMMFDEGTIDVLAYSLETVLAEKLETVLSRSIANTRPRDFYDIHILYLLRRNEYDADLLRQALERTAEKRNSEHILGDYPEILHMIRESVQLRGHWEKYRKEFDYARMHGKSALTMLVIPLRQSWSKSSKTSWLE